MEFVARLIGEARSRQRRRRVRIAWGMVVVLAFGVAVRAFVPASHVESGGGSFAFAPPSAVFTQDPYMGVRCPVPNSIACDRVGLAVWLRHPAVRVFATIADQPVLLDWFGDQRHVGPVPPRAELDGYLKPAHLTTLLGVRPTASGMWSGNLRGPWPAPTVRLWITYANGQRVTTALQVPLSPGWG